MHLVGMPDSPWTEKARWALDHHRIAHEFEPYTPILGELGLRARLRAVSGRVTVPVLFTRHGALRSSRAIAEFADRIGREAPLFPREHHDAIAGWDDASDRALQNVRLLVTCALTRSPAALEEAAPPLVPRPLRRPLAASGLAAFRFKYKISGAAEHDAELALASSLEGLRAALGGRATLLSQFTYADIAMAVLLQGVTPVDDRFVPLPPATRQLWRREALATRFADLVEWRDRLYAAHRQRTGA